MNLAVRDDGLRELMDDPGCDPARLDATLRRFETINRLVSAWGTTYRTRLAPHLASLGRPARVLDLGSGGGDLVLRLARRARQDGFTVEWLGVDPDPRAHAIALGREEEGIRFACTDAEALVARGERFDAVLSNHVLHHLDGDVVPFIEASRTLSRGIVLHGDIARGRLAYGLYAVGVTPFAPGTFLRTDGLRSIRRSFTPAELQAVLDEGSPDAWTVVMPGPFRVLAIGTVMPDVVVVGAGPVGMLLAGELARRGVEVEVYERRAVAGDGSRAIGVHAPVLGALEASGVTERLLAHAQRVPRGEARDEGRALGVVRFDRLSMRFPFVATLPQAATEAVLAAEAPEPLRGAEVLALLPRDDRVRVRAGVAGHITELDAGIVVVASGAAGRALVYRRPQAHEYRDRYLMADVAVESGSDDGTAVVNLDASGVLESFPLPDGMRRFVAWDRPGASAAPDDRAARLRTALERRGQDASTVAEATGFGVRRFVAPRLRRGRVLVIGDAAHEVSPIGGQGMNLGLLDAVTLAPLLAEWTRTGEAPDEALRRWERRRVRSARTAASLASLNTALGRPLDRAAHAARRAAVTAMLAGAAGSLFARAYAMGFDRDA